MIKIRLSQKGDCEALSVLMRDSILKINAKDYSADIIETWAKRSTVERCLTSLPNCKRWVVTKDGKIVGYCDHGLNNEFWGLYVHANFIGQGIGSLLLKTVEESLQKAGCKEVILKSSITARGFYEKHGYLFVKKDFHHVSDKKIRVFVMNKKLL